MDFKSVCTVLITVFVRIITCQPEQFVQQFETSAVQGIPSARLNSAVQHFGSLTNSFGNSAVQQVETIPTGLNSGVQQFQYPVNTAQYQYSPVQSSPYIDGTFLSSQQELNVPANLNSYYSPRTEQFPLFPAYQPTYDVMPSIYQPEKRPMSVLQGLIAALKNTFFFGLDAAGLMQDNRYQRLRKVADDVNIVLDDVGGTYDSLKRVIVTGINKLARIPILGVIVNWAVQICQFLMSIPNLIYESIKQFFTNWFVGQPSVYPAGLPFFQ